VEALELREVALIVSMVINVILLRLSPSMRCTKIELKAESIWSWRKMVEEKRGVQSYLIRSLLFQSVGAFLSGEEDSLLVEVGAGVEDAWLLDGAGVFFFFFVFFVLFVLFVTMAHFGARLGGASLEVEWRGRIVVGEGLSKNQA
jgi:hypothetical protein